MIRRLAVLALMVALPSLGHAGTDAPDGKYLLFDGRQNADSSEQASPWIPVKGANRIVIRLRSQNTASWSTGADTQYVDSIAIWKVLLSDSALFQACDSAGTTVTFNHRFPRSDVRSGPFPMCADSVVITGVENAITPDTTYKQASVSLAPLAKKLRPPANGSGVYTYIIAALPPAGTSIYGDGTIQAQFMRIRYTPYTRMTLGGFSSTAGIRTKGINGLRVEAEIIRRGGQ